jgi:hypothetical protein
MRMFQCANVLSTLPSSYQTKGPARVTYLLDAIQCNDPDLQAAMANVRTDTDPVDDKMNDFEATASYRLLSDPVSKKRAAGNKRGLASISEVSGADDTTDVSSVTFGGNGGKSKAFIGKTGVEFHYYKPLNTTNWGLTRKLNSRSIVTTRSRFLAQTRERSQEIIPAMTGNTRSGLRLPLKSTLHRKDRKSRTMTTQNLSSKAML